MPVLAPSNAFIDAIRFGAQIVVADLTVFEYSVLGAIAQTFALPVSACQITNDRNSAIRRSGSLSVELTPSVPPPALLPTAPPTPGSPQPLAPFGNEVAISLGLASNSNATPKAVVTGSIAANALQLQVADLTGQGLQFTLGSTICFSGSGAAPAVVGGISQQGTNTYLITLLTPGLTAAVTANTPVAPAQFVPLGLFTITSTTVDATAPNLTVTLDVSDRAFVIAARETTAPYKFPATASGTFEDEVTTLLNAAWGTYPGLPPLTFNFSDCNNPIVPKSTYNQGSNPWQMALDLAEVAGNELYFDVNGVVTAHTYPDVTTQPVSWYFTSDDSNIFSVPGHTIADGSPYQVPVGVQVHFTREGIYNDVYITGSGSQNAPGVSTSSSTATGAGGSTSTSSASPVLGHQADLNPASATYVQGPLGDLPEFVASNLLPTASQAQAMASLDLAMSVSSAWQITVSAQPNPLFDVDDVVVVNHPELGLVGPPATTTPTNVTLEGSFAQGATAVQVTAPLGQTFPLVPGDRILIGSASYLSVLEVTQVATNAWQLVLSGGLSSAQAAGAAIGIISSFTGLCMVVDTVETGVRYADVTTVTGRVIPGRYA